jgi:hypothetical protein
MQVEFVLWDEHALTSRLTLERHAGRRWFWFRETELSAKWFGDHLSEVLKYAGPRYTPNVNVELPISHPFETLAVTAEFRRGFRDRLRHVTDAWTRVSSAINHNATKAIAGAPYQALEMRMKKLEHASAALSRRESELRCFAAIRSEIDEAGRAVYECNANFDHAFTQLDGRSGSRRQNARVRPEDRFEAEFSGLRKLQDELESLVDFATDFQIDLLARPALLIVGDAGSGKTHLLCDIARNRIEAGFAALLILGQRFGGPRPLNELSQLARLGCTSDELLGAMDAAGEAAGSRSLILIDAVNEALGINWQDELPAALSVISRFPHVGVVVTCRSTYERCVIRSDLVPNALSRLEHRGFADSFDLALGTFFDYYGIEAVSTPPLAPEFTNPLFLRMFCEGLQNKGMSKPPKGLRGLLKVFHFWMDSVNQKLARPAKLDFVESENVVSRAADRLAAAMAEKGQTWLSLDDARNCERRPAAIRRTQCIALGEAHCRGNSHGGYAIRAGFGQSVAFCAVLLRATFGPPDCAIPS